MAEYSDYTSYFDFDFATGPRIVETEAQKKEREEKEAKLEQEELAAAERVQISHSAMNSNPSSFAGIGKTAVFLITASVMVDSNVCRGCMKAITTASKKWMNWKKCQGCEHLYCSESCMWRAKPYHNACKGNGPEKPPAVVLDIPALVDAGAPVIEQKKVTATSATSISEIKKEEPRISITSGNPRYQAIQNKAIALEKKYGTFWNRFAGWNTTPLAGTPGDGNYEWRQKKYFEDMEDMVDKFEKEELEITKDGQGDISR